MGLGSGAGAPRLDGALPLAGALTRRALRAAHRFRGGDGDRLRASSRARASSASRPGSKVGHRVGSRTVKVSLTTDRVPHYLNAGQRDDATCRFRPLPDGLLLARLWARRDLPPPKYLEEWVPQVSSHHTSTSQELVLAQGQRVLVLSTLGPGAEVLTRWRARSVTGRRPRDRRDRSLSCDVREQVQGRRPSSRASTELTLAASGWDAIVCAFGLWVSDPHRLPEGASGRCTLSLCRRADRHHLTFGRPEATRIPSDAR